MRFLIAGISFAILLSFPFVTSAYTVQEIQAEIDALLAQIAALQKQIKEEKPAVALIQCPLLTRTLSQGARGDDVKALQEFLRSENEFHEESTGYFGIFTMRAVERWQAGASIEWSGLPILSGLGIAGPKTRAKIREKCLAKLNPIPIATLVCKTVATTTPAAPCGVKWELVQDTNCNAEWKCAVPPKGPNRPPVFHNIVGPSSIVVGATGEWTIQATDPDDDALEYSITWGEVDSALGILEKIAGESSFTSSDSFTYAYNNVGSYFLRAKVRDAEGKEAGGTFTVNVKTFVEPVCTDCAGAVAGDPDGDVLQGGELVFVPDGVTHCMTPWGGRMVPSGNSVLPETYFKGSAPAGVGAMKCVLGKWYRCDKNSAHCVAHAVPTENATMAGLQTYMALIGSSCGTHLAAKTVKTSAGSLLCKDDAGAPGVCAMTQEDTAINIHCAHTNWAETFTL